MLIFTFKMQWRFCNRILLKKNIFNFNVCSFWAVVEAFSVILFVRFLQMGELRARNNYFWISWA